MCHSNALAELQINKYTGFQYYQFVAHRPCIPLACCTCYLFRFIKHEFFSEAEKAFITVLQTASVAVRLNIFLGPEMLFQYM